MLFENKLENILSRTGELPPMPHIATKVISLTQNQNSTAKDIQLVISRDQALTAKILKMSNSALFGRSRTITTLSNAIMMLGFYTIRSLVVANTTRSLFGSGRKFVDNLLWQHSIASAIVARNISTRLRYADPEEAFIAGLLHDIGKMILLKTLGDEYHHIFQDTYNNSFKFLDTENDQLGFNHTDVGALLARKWNFSKKLEDAIAFHHDPAKAADDSKLTAIISFANDICLKMGIGVEKCEDLNIEASDASAILGLNNNRGNELYEEISTNLRENPEILEI